MSVLQDPLGFDRETGSAFSRPISFQGRTAGE